MTQLVRNREDENRALWHRIITGEEQVCVIIDGGVFVCYDPNFESGTTTPGFSFMWVGVDHGCAQIGCAFGVQVRSDHTPIPSIEAAVFLDHLDGDEQ